jgi:lauroyl/myristoyl acyltransferase
LGYIRKLERRLRENGLVSINCGAIRDQKRVEKPILNGRIQLATGAPSLALATGAALLPVFTIRRAPGDFEIIIEPSLDLPEIKNRHKAVELLIYKYAKLVESYMVRYPTLFFWGSLGIDEES